MHVQSGETKRQVDGTLKRSHFISGQVRTPSGHPLAGIRVIALNHAGRELGNYKDGRDLTDRNGRYRIEGLHAVGGVRVCAYPDTDHTARQSRCSGHAPWSGAGGEVPPSARNVRVRADNTTRVDLTLPVGATVSGRVVLAGTRAPVAHMYVYAFTPNGVQWAEDYTDASGGYNLSRLHASNSGYVLCAAGISSGYTRLPPSEGAPTCWRSTAWTGRKDSLPTSARRLLLRARQHRRGIDLVASPAGTITGTITDANTGGDLDAAVSVYDASGNQIGSSDTDGRYRIGGLAPSTTGYAVCAGALKSQASHPAVINPRVDRGAGVSPKLRGVPQRAGDGNRTRTVSLGS